MVPIIGVYSSHLILDETISIKGIDAGIILFANDRFGHANRFADSPFRLGIGDLDSTYRVEESRNR